MRLRPSLLNSRPHISVPALWLLALVAACFSMQASAFEFVYDPERNASLVECDNLFWVGDRSKAQGCYRQVLRTNPTLAVQAEAAWALDDLGQASQLYQRAVQVDSENPALRTRWGRLFIRTYQEADAVTLFQEALVIDPDYHRATLGIALGLAEQYGNNAQEQLDEALNADPDLMEGYLLSALFAIELNRYEAAEAYIVAAENLAERYDWTQLEIYALRASSALMQEQDPTEWIDLALETNPNWGGVYETLGQFYLQTYRYSEAIDAFKKSVEIEPTRWSAHSQLGINLLRKNQIAEGQYHLEIAYGGDAYNPATVNTLRLLDTFNEFEVVSGEVELNPATDEQRAYAVPVLWRMHSDERDLLEPYLRKLTEDSIRTFSERYRFQPQEPIVMELFPNHDDFTVRTVSTPGVGLLGVTFGYLFAMDSPTAGRQGDFHWGSVFWHEMAHVFTVTASEHKVPRWFTEGISMYEEWQTGPSPGIKIPDYFLQAHAQRLLLPIAELDNGFVRPTYEDQVMVSYVQAGLLCQYIDEQWGFEKLVDVLYRFPEGDSVEEAVTSVIGYPIDVIDDDFITWLDTKYGDVVANIDRWNEMRSGMTKAYAAEAWDETIKGADIAIEIYPEYVEEDSPYLYKALALDKKEQPEQAKETLKLYFEMGGHNARGLSKLADLLIDAGELTEAVEVLSALNLIIPQDQSVHSRLGEIALELNLPEIALTEFSVLMALSPHDQASVLLGKAKAYQQLGDYSKMRRQLLMALDIAPHYREAQQLLLAIPKDPT